MPKKKKKQQKGRGKGAGFERDTCRDFSKWISRGTRDDVFWRTAMSGGRATQGSRKGKIRDAQLGDLCAIDKSGAPLLQEFIVECKFWNNLDLELFIFLHSGKLTSFWNQVKTQARQRSREPLLVARQNRLETLVIMTEVGYKRLFPRIKPEPLAIVMPQEAHILYLNALLEWGVPPRGQLS